MIDYFGAASLELAVPFRCVEFNSAAHWTGETSFDSNQLIRQIVFHRVTGRVDLNEFGLICHGVVNVDLARQRVDEIQSGKSLGRNPWISRLSFCISQPWNRFKNHLSCAHQFVGRLTFSKAAAVSLFKRQSLLTRHNWHKHLHICICLFCCCSRHSSLAFHLHLK